MNVLMLLAALILLFFPILALSPLIHDGENIFDLCCKFYRLFDKLSQLKNIAYTIHVYDDVLEDNYICKDVGNIEVDKYIDKYKTIINLIDSKLNKKELLYGRIISTINNIRMVLLENCNNIKHYLFVLKNLEKNQMKKDIAASIRTIHGNNIEMICNMDDILFYLSKLNEQSILDRNENIEENMNRLSDILNQISLEEYRYE